jgi:hypothetical protein
MAHERPRCSTLVVLLSGELSELFCRSGERGTGRVAKLVLRVNEGEVCETDEPEDVTQIRFLKIETSIGLPLFVAVLFLTIRSRFEITRPHATLSSRSPPAAKNTACTSLRFRSASRINST